MEKIGIESIVNVRNNPDWAGVLPFWKGKVTEIRNGGREITIQGKGKWVAVLDVDDLEFKNSEFWEKDIYGKKMV